MDNLEKHEKKIFLCSSETRLALSIQLIITNIPKIKRIFGGYFRVVAFYTMRTGSFPGVERGRGVTLTPHPF
jgi:hypothetical protein